MKNTNYPFNDVNRDSLIVKKGNKYGVIDYKGNIIEQIKFIGLINNKELEMI